MPHDEERNEEPTPVLEVHLHSSFNMVQRLVVRKGGDTYQIWIENSTDDPKAGVGVIFFTEGGIDELIRSLRFLQRQDPIDIYGRHR